MPLTKSQEKKLVHAAKKDFQAFAKLYKHYYSPIFNYLLKRTADYHTACDLTSLTFLKAQRAIKNYQWQGISFSSWLYRIATNEAHSHFRKVKVKKLIPIEIVTPFLASKVSSQPDYKLLADEKQNRIKSDFKKAHRLIGHLSLKEQSTISLKFFENKTNKQIAQILVLPEGTVKSHLHRGLKKLGDLFDKSATRKEVTRSNTKKHK